MPYVIRDDDAFKMGISLWLRPRTEYPEKGNRGNYPLDGYGMPRAESIGYWTSDIHKAAWFDCYDDAEEASWGGETIIDLIQLALTTDFLTKELPLMAWADNTNPEQPKE